MGNDKSGFTNEKPIFRAVSKDGTVTHGEAPTLSEEEARKLYEKLAKRRAEREREARRQRKSASGS